VIFNVVIAIANHTLSHISQNED